MTQIALITETERPELSESDRLLVAPLQQLGITAVPVPWDAADAHWHKYAALILRSCWLYHRQAERFREWIEWLQQQNISLWNPAPVVLWNMDKQYLRDLSERDVAVPPTVWLEKGETAELPLILQQQQWQQAVIKPRISASAYNIWAASLADSPQQQLRFQTMLNEHGVMVQQFVPEIANGEWSLVFFAGEYSHAALKTPAANNILVQQRFGGSTQAAVPSTKLVEQARFALQQAMKITQTAVSPLYARVDGVEVNGRFVLMELELIEPGLFLMLHTPAPELFATAIHHFITHVTHGFLSAAQ